MRCTFCRQLPCSPCCALRLGLGARCGRVLAGVVRCSRRRCPAIPLVSLSGQPWRVVRSRPSYGLIDFGSKPAPLRGSPDATLGRMPSSSLGWPHTIWPSSPAASWMRPSRTPHSAPSSGNGWCVLLSCMGRLRRLRSTMFSVGVGGVSSEHEVRGSQHQRNQRPLRSLGLCQRRSCR